MDTGCLNVYANGLMRCSAGCSGGILLEVDVPRSGRKPFVGVTDGSRIQPRAPGEEGLEPNLNTVVTAPGPPTLVKDKPRYSMWSLSQITYPLAITGLPKDSPAAGNTLI